MSIKVKVKLKKVVIKPKLTIEQLKDRYTFNQPKLDNETIRNTYSFLNITSPTMEASNADTRPKRNISRSRVEGYKNSINSAISYITGNVSPNKDERTDIHNQSLKAWEWAVENKKIINSQEFYNKWEQQGMIHGGENTLVFNESKQTVIKANDLGYHHNDIVAFLDRIKASNKYFPSTSYTLKGFMQQGEKVIPVVEQPFIKEAKDVRLSHRIVANELIRRGFISVNQEAGLWLTPDKKYIAGDMGPSNVIMDTDANFRFIDAMFIPATEENLYEYGIETPK